MFVNRITMVTIAFKAGISKRIAYYIIAVLTFLSGSILKLKKGSKQK